MRIRLAFRFLFFSSKHLQDLEARHCNCDLAFSHGTIFEVSHCQDGVISREELGCPVYIYIIYIYIYIYIYVEGTSMYRMTEFGSGI